MKQYPQYKDSGIQWIGKIPKHWEIKKIKWLVKGKLKYGANESTELDDDSLPRYIRITDFDKNGKLRTDTFKSLRNESARDYLLEDGDILFARSGATVGKTFQYKEYKGSACFAGYLIKATPNSNLILSDFLYLYTKSNPYENWKDGIFIQSTIQNIGADKYQTLITTLPTINEQKSITQFLNTKIKKIELLVDKKQRLIELLKEQRAAMINRAVTKGLNPNAPMKDSGIEWLGKIPQHWEVKKLKYLTLDGLKNGVFKKSNEFGSGTKLINVINLYKTTFTINENELERVVTNEEESKKYNVKIGDIFFVRSSLKREGIAVAAFIDKINEPLVYECHIIKISPAPNTIIPYFLVNYFNCSILRNRLISLSITTTMTTISQDNLSALEVVLPPKNEQIKIMDYIKDKTIKIDKTISRIEKEIELLKEYRAALISEVVTGKIDVRDFVPDKTNSR